MRVFIQKVLFLTHGLLLCLTSLVIGQVNNKDFTGVISKFDTTFSGTGPEVYFLPKPKSKAESLTDQYRVIETEDGLVKRKIMLQQIINNFGSTSDEQYIQTIVLQNNLQSANWENISNTEVQKGNTSVAIGLLNIFAKEYLQQNLEIEAEAILEKAIKISENYANKDDQQIILKNLFTIYLYNNSLVKANAIEENFYKEAQKNKSLQEQASSLVKLAEIDAFQKEFKLAESTIIRKAIPLLNRSKDYNGKVLAWIKLAEIYASNQQYTEAQWFLIQAQELANQKQLNEHRATIEYMLGEAKYYQKNVRVAQIELGRALKLAQESQNMYIELLTTKRLGEISLQQNRIADAERFLKSYWTLRNKLF